MLCRLARTLFLAVRGKNVRSLPWQQRTDRDLTTVFAPMTTARVLYNAKRMSNNMVEFNCVRAGRYDLKKVGKGPQTFVLRASHLSTDDFGCM